MRYGSGYLDEVMEEYSKCTWYDNAWIIPAVTEGEMSRVLEMKLGLCRARARACGLGLHACTRSLSP